MLISNKPMLNTGNFSVKIGNTAIAAANSIKYLGVLFDDKLSWDKRIQHVISKLSSAIGILHKLKFYAPPSLLEKVCYGIVYPHLSYAITTWGKAASTRLNKIQVMQNRLVRIITKKCNRRTSMSPLYKQLSILKLSNIFKLEVTKFMTKKKYNNLPELFQDHFYSTTDIHKFATRQAGPHDSFLPRSSSKFAQNSIKVCGVEVWNSLFLLLKEKVKFGKRTFIKALKSF